MATTKITTPELFDFSATNTALQLPTGTTAQRPTSPSAGEWRFNTTEKYVEYWDGGSPGAWRQIDTEPGPMADDFPSQNFNVNTYIGNGGTQTIDAKFNEAANFNGASSGSQIIISDADVFSPANNDLSFSVWINTTSTNVAYIASKQDDGAATYEWQFYMNSNGTVVISVFTSAGSTIAIATSTATINDGNWHNIAFVIDTNTSVTVYVDKAGVTSSSWSGTMTNTSTDVSLGSGGTAIPAVRLPGKLDQARFFNTAITQSQIDSLYDDETTTTAATLNFPVGAGCFAAYQLDGDASDISGTYGGVTTDIGYTGLRFQPDLIWIKERSGTEWHNLFDSVRGYDKSIYSNDSSAEATSSTKLTSFDTNGFSLGSDNNVNKSSSTYVAWAFKGGGAPTATNSAGAGNVPTAGSVKIDGADSTAALAGATPATNISANTGAGISIVQYTGPASNSTVGHGLGVAPSMIIQKPTSSGNWYVYFAPGVIDATSDYYYLILDSNASKGTTSSAAPTTTTFNVAGSGVHIAYCFANIANYQKIGSYAGNSSTSNIISTEITAGDGGFEPAFIIIKNATSGDNWIMLDNKRLNGGFPYTNVLYPNLSNSELANVGGNGEYSINFLTNGFELTEITAGYNQSGETYIYLAIAADKDSSVPTQANSFSPTIYTGNGGTQNISTPFAPDFTWIKSRTGAAESHVWNDTIRGKSNAIYSNSSGTQYFNSGVYTTSFNPNGFTIGDNAAGNYGVNGNALNYVSWNWKAGGLPTINSDGDITSIVSANVEAGFSIVSYTATGSTATVGHGLGAAPDLILAKTRDQTYNWIAYSSALGSSTEMSLNLTNAAQTGSSIMASTDPTSTVFTAGAGNNLNYANGNTIIAYCFADIAGYQKIGSYTGNGSTTGPIETTGFEPRFLLIKSADNASTDWIILDKARTPNNPMENDLKANSTAVEQTGTGNNYPQATTSATGFQVNTTDGSVNGSGTYIYLAIA